MDRSVRSSHRSAGQENTSQRNDELSDTEEKGHGEAEGQNPGGSFRHFVFGEAPDDPGRQGGGNRAEHDQRPEQWKMGSRGARLRMGR